MDKRDFLNLGENIKNIVQDAVNNRDFKKLNSDIGNTVNSAIDEVRKSIVWNQRDNQQRNRVPNPQIWQNSNNDINNSNIVNNPVQKQYAPIAKQSNSYVPVGRVSGVLLTTFGIIGSITLGIASIMSIAFGNLIGSNHVFNAIALGILPFFIASIFMWSNGNGIRRRIKRLRQYISLLRGRNYCLIKDFSSATRFSNKFIVKDLQKMISIGMFPEGHIDDKKTCFMLNHESYEQYLKLQENMKMQCLDEQAKQKEQKREEQTTEKSDAVGQEIKNAIGEGRLYIQKIKKANDEIPGQEVSNKLDRLEQITGKIFDYVEFHPEQISEIKKFMEYYLPTTLKLLDAYKEFDYQSVQGENISTAKKEIEKTLDTINIAFENLLDSLFEDAAMDISTDISVLETMFAQEGLTAKEFKNQNK